jgi:hypothetical protein
MSRAVVAWTIAGTLMAASAQAEPVKCQNQIIKSLLKFKQTYLKALEKCADSENLDKISGPCPDAATQLNIDGIKTKARAEIDLSCPAPDLTTLGFPTDCAFESTATGIESACAALPVGNGGELADCLMCWKGAELSKYVATLYASHASELCGGALDETSPSCSELDCATPLPVQRDLGNTGENDCQKTIGSGGIKHLVAIEKALEKCGLLGHDRAFCEADPAVQAEIAKAGLKLDTLVRNKCGNRDPVVDPPFCCSTGQANACTASTSRSECESNLGGTVQEGKTCGVGNTCDPAGGPNQRITWWSTCPKNDTCDATLDTLDELISCANATAEETAAELLCLQFPSGWGPCPPDAGPP